jgi:hypothetical protein
VSGAAKIKLGTLTRGRFKSISGNVTTELALAPDARLDGESVSGGLDFKFPAVPRAEFDIQSFSGAIDNCFGPKPTQPRYGPGSRLSFKNGDGEGRVHINTQSGNVRLCAKDARISKIRNLAPPPQNPFYLI